MKYFTVDLCFSYKPISNHILFHCFTYTQLLMYNHLFLEDEQQQKQQQQPVIMPVAQWINKIL